jgi:hypothetical protein
MLLGDFAWSSEQPCLAFLFESEAFAVNADDDRAVQNAIEPRRCETINRTITKPDTVY